MQRSSKSLLTIVGTALGIAACVAVIGVTSSANGQISKEFNNLTATTFSVQVTDQARPHPDHADSLFPVNAESRVAHLNGVAAAAITWDVSVEHVSVLPQPHPSTQIQARVIAASPRYWELATPKSSTGRVFDEALRDEAVAVIGADLIEQFGAAAHGDRAMIYVNDQALTIIGIIHEMRGAREANSAIIVPDNFARIAFGPPGLGERLTVRGELGTRTMLTEQLALAIDPTHPEWFRVTPPPAPTVARDRVSMSVQNLLLGLAAITLAVGVVGVTNASLIGVMSRVPEIGLRRALGAQRRHIAAQFLLESAVKGLLGGTIGAMIGLLTIVSVSLVNAWTPVFDLWLALLAPFGGMLFGGVAGLYPAIRAARIEPIAAFRQP